nr:Toll-like receptor [Ruditapes philippinarum]
MLMYTNIIFLMISLSTCVAQYTDDLNEMLQNVNDIFTVYRGQSFEKPTTAEECHDIPQCHCTDPGSGQGLLVDCKRQNLTEIPSKLPLNTTQLILSMNSISSIPANILKNYVNMTYLDLSYNKIKQLGKDSFNGLENLKILNLEMNQVRYTNITIHYKTFQPLILLSAINLQQDLSEISNKERYPKEALAHLINLKQLAIDVMPTNAFHKQSEGMSISTLNYQSLKLEYLQLGGINRRCNIPEIFQGMFKNLPDLLTLTIQDCKLKSVQNKSFTELPKLESLDLSNNEELQFKSLANISYGLQFTNIKTLTLRKIHATFGDCTKLTAHNLRYLYNLSLKYIFLDSNRLALFERDAVKFIPRSLIGLSLNDNKLMLGKYVIQIAINIAFNDFFANLKVFLIASQRVNHSFKELFSHMSMQEILTMLGDHQKQKRSLYSDQQSSVANVKYDTRNFELFGPRDVLETSPNTYHTGIKFLSRLLLRFFGSKCQSCTNISPRILQLPLPMNLTVADLSHLGIKTIIKPLCFCENKLQNLSLNGNTFWYWKGPLMGLNKLTHLNLAWDYCQKISLDFFHHFPKLRLLNVSGNYLGFPLSTDNDGTIFSKLSKLEILHMSSNKIQFMPTIIFKGLELLQELYLDSNQINVVNWNMDHMTELKFIDLSDNQIVNIDGNVRHQWNNLASQHALSINLANNSFICNCMYIDQINWFSDTNVCFINHRGYKCKFNNNTSGNLISADVISRSLTKDCANYMTVILSTSLALLATIILTVSGIAYRYRWNLRYMYYSAKFKLKGYSPGNTEEDDFEHDVFISYADGDGTFVRRNLVPELENNRGLNLLVHDRDFQAGNYVNDNIMKAITTSRKTLIIMSRHFLQSKWCCYEMNMARMEGIQTGREVICILMKEEVPTSGLPLEIIDIIRNKTYIECPAENPNHLQQFWDRLADAIIN